MRSEHEAEGVSEAPTLLKIDPLIGIEDDEWVVAGNCRMKLRSSEILSHHISADSARPLHHLVAATKEFLSRKSGRNLRYRWICESARNSKIEPFASLARIGQCA